MSRMCKALESRPSVEELRSNFNQFNQKEISLKERNDLQKKNYREMLEKNNRKNKRSIYKII